MKSESPRKAIFASPLASGDVGGEQEFGRLVAAATLSGMTVREVGEKAVINLMMAQFAVSEAEAIRLLRVLESDHKGSTP